MSKKNQNSIMKNVINKSENTLRMEKMFINFLVYSYIVEEPWVAIILPLPNHLILANGSALMTRV